MKKAEKVKRRPAPRNVKIRPVSRKITALLKVMTRRGNVRFAGKPVRRLRKVS